MRSLYGSSITVFHFSKSQVNSNTKGHISRSEGSKFFCLDSALDPAGELTTSPHSVVGRRGDTCPHTPHIASPIFQKPQSEGKYRVNTALITSVGTQIHSTLDVLYADMPTG